MDDLKEWLKPLIVAAIMAAGTTYGNVLVNQVQIDTLQTAFAASISRIDSLELAIKLLQISDAEIRVSLKIVGEEQVRRTDLINRFLALEPVIRQHADEINKLKALLNTPSKISSMERRLDEMQRTINKVLENMVRTKAALDGSNP